MPAPVAQTIIVDTADVGTTILAAIGVGLALSSLAWQAWIFVLSGSRVTVEVRAGVRRGEVVVTASTTPTVEELEAFRVQGLTDRVLAVKVINSGRGPTSVMSVELRLPRGAGVSNAQLDPPLPHRLQGESEQVWYFPWEQAEGYARALQQTLTTGESYAVRGVVQLGGKKEPVVSENEIRVL